MKNILKRVRELLADNYDLSPESVTLQSKLRVDLGLDSLDLTEAIMAIEEEFDFEFDDDKVDDFQTVEDMCQYIKGHAEL